MNTNCEYRSNPEIVNCSFKNLHYTRIVIASPEVFDRVSMNQIGTLVSEAENSGAACKVRQSCKVSSPMNNRVSKSICCVQAVSMAAGNLAQGMDDTCAVIEIKADERVLNRPKTWSQPSWKHYFSCFGDTR